MRIMRVNWNDESKENLYGGKGFWCYDEKVYSTLYHGYTIEVEHRRNVHDNGKVSGYYAVYLLKYDDNNWLEELYCLTAALFTAKELWQYIAELELDSTASAIQTAKNPWCAILVKALEQGQLWVELNNQVFTFEPDFDEFVIEIWSQYRLNNGALTTMSYCANIWEDELPVNIRKAVFGV